MGLKELKVVCLSCKKFVEIKSTNYDVDPKYNISHTLCKECLKETLKEFEEIK